MLLIAFFALLAISLFQDLLLNFRVSSFLLLLQELILMAILFIRRPSISTSARPHEWALAFAATFLPLILRAHGTGEYMIGTAFSIAGTLVGILGLFALNRSIGVVPANRGIQTGGMYKWVRHPLYASYIIAFGGFLINNFSTQNALILAAWFVFQALRLLAEERHLAQDPDYRQFMQSTRWRLIPGLW